MNTTAQRYLKHRVGNFRTTHNPDMKGAVIEGFNRKLKTKMYKYFTKNNTYRYLDAINKILTGYISVHSTIGMSPCKVNPSNIYSVWQKMSSLRSQIPRGRVKFN